MTTKTWFGGTGSFANASDWSPSSVPVAGDTAVVNTGTLNINHQNLAYVGLTVGPNLSTVGGSPVVDIKDSILGAVTAVAQSGSAPVNQTINVSDYAIFAGKVALNGLVSDATINISRHSLLLNFNTIELINGIDMTLNITGQHGAVLDNEGLVEVLGGFAAKLTIAPDVTGDGTIEVGAFGGTTEFGGAVSSRQTFEFSNTTNGQESLQLDMAKEFKATITNFSSIDTIDLKGVTVTSDTFKNGVLTLKDGSHTVVNLHFAGSFTTSDFVTQISGSDTLIKHG